MLNLIAYIKHGWADKKSNVFPDAIDTLVHQGMN